MITNYYSLLKIEPSADLNSIKKAFRREIANYHPDNNASPDAKPQFELIIEAFEVLSDAEKRKAYNELLKYQSTNKPAVIEQKEQYEDWQKEAKTKSKKYYDFGLDELLLLDIFILNGDILEGLLTGADDLLEELSDIFDLF